MVRFAGILGVLLLVSVAGGCHGTGHEQSACRGADLLVVRVGATPPVEVGDIGEYSRLAVLDPESGRTSFVTPVSMNAEDPSFSPDGRRVVFANGVGSYESAGPGEYTLWVLDRHDRSFERITGGSDWTQTGGSPTTPANDEQPDWSPTDDEIVFSHNGRDIGTDPQLGHNALFIVRPGHPPRALLPPTDNGTNDLEPAWSPDGNRIAFIRLIVTDPLKAPSAQLWVVDADGTDAHPLADAYGDQPVWWPDDDTVVLTGHTNASEAGETDDLASLRQVDLNTGAVTRLGPAVAVLASTSDGKRLYSGQRDPRGQGLELSLTTVANGTFTVKGVSSKDLDRLGYVREGLDVTSCPG